MVKRKLLDIARDTLRRKHLSYRTEQAYIYWMRKFILFHGKRPPVEMGEAEVPNDVVAGFLWSAQGNQLLVSARARSVLSALDRRFRHAFHAIRISQTLKKTFSLIRFFSGCGRRNEGNEFCF